MKFTEAVSRMVVSRVVMVMVMGGGGEGCAGGRWRAGMLSCLMDLEIQFCKRKGVLEIA